jgi:hypothetical protein
VVDGHSNGIANSVINLRRASLSVLVFLLSNGVSVLANCREPKAARCRHALLDEAMAALDSFMAANENASEDGQS